MNRNITMPTTEGFWDRLADRYAAKPVPDQAVYEHKLDLTRELLTPESTVLEIGCGTGSTAIALAPSAGRVLAIDISSRMIAIAQDKAAAAGVSNVEFLRAPAQPLPAEDASLDAVLAHNLLHLLDDWRGALAAAHRTLRPGGVLVMSTMCMNDGFWFMRPVVPLGRMLGLLPELSFFSRATLEEGIEAAGFILEKAWLPGPRRSVFHIARKPS